MKTVECKIADVEVGEEITFIPGGKKYTITAKDAGGFCIAVERCGSADIRGIFCPEDKCFRKYNPKLFNELSTGSVFYLKYATPPTIPGGLEGKYNTLYLKIDSEPYRGGDYQQYQQYLNNKKNVVNLEDGSSGFFELHQVIYVCDIKDLRYYYQGIKVQLDYFAGK